MKFKIGDRIYNLGFLIGMAEGDWQIHFNESEGLLFTTLTEQDVMGNHGEPTGEKCTVWKTEFTIAAGPDAAALWAALTRALVSEKVCLDVDDFLANVEEYDAAVNASRASAREMQRLRRLEAEESVAESSGLSLAALRSKKQILPYEGGIEMVPPYGGRGRN